MIELARSALVAGRFVLATIVATASTPVGAQEPYPDRPVQIIVPSGPGGGYDVTARITAEALSRRLGQPIVIENRVGAAGTIGVARAATSAPDGYTLVWGGNGPLTLSPYIYRNVGYDPIRSFVPISVAATSSYALVVSANAPVASVEQLIALGKSRPGELTYASNGQNGALHLLGEVLTALGGFEALHIPYKGGAEGVTAVMSGRVDFTFDAMSTNLPLVLSGRLRALAVTGSRRDLALPDVPTFAELGMASLTSDIFFGLLAPAATPQPIIERLSEAMRQALAEQTVREAVSRSGNNPQSSTPQEFLMLINDETARWRSVLEEKRITPQ